MKIDGETRILGLIGEGIAYSSSPAMHNRFFQLASINAVYLPFDLPAERCLPLVDALLAAGALGFNVTQPHKKLFASAFGGEGRRSVNTLVATASGWQAHSTDGVGFVAGLTRICRGLEQFEKLVMIGGGGAAIAVLEHLHEIKASCLQDTTLLRRSTGDDDSLRDSAGTAIEILPLTLPDLTGAIDGRGAETLLVQATSAPLQGDRLEWLVPALSNFSGVFVDLVYGKPSALYDACLARDLKAQDGEAMLIEQARAAQMLWFGKAAAYVDMAAALRGKY